MNTLRCKSCHIILSDEFRCFGQYEDGKDVWCNNCWNELQDYLKRKHQTEKLPELISKTKELQEQLSETERKLKNLIRETRTYLLTLNRNIPNNKIENIYTQSKLKEMNDEFS